MRPKFRKFFSDKLRCSLTTIVTALCLAPAPTFAQFDINLEVLTRSYPLSGYLTVQSGYGFPLWGTPGADNYFYGYLRPYIDLTTAGTYNSGFAAVEFYPLSFFGIKAGKEWIQNDKKYRDGDCDRYNCVGARTREFLEVQMLAGYDIWFAALTARWEAWKQKGNVSRDFVEPTSLLISDSGGDTQTLLRGFTGLKIWDEWAVIAGVSYYQMTRVPGISRFSLVGARWKQESLSVVVGATLFDSTVARNDVGAMFLFNWNAIAGLALQ